MRVSGIDTGMPIPIARTDRGAHLNARIGNSKVVRNGRAVGDGVCRSTVAWVGTPSSCTEVPVEEEDTLRQAPLIDMWVAPATSQYGAIST